MKKIILLTVLFSLVNSINAQTPLKKDSTATKSNALGRTKEEAKQLVEYYREQVLKGEDFGALAFKYSEDPGSAKKGGQLSAFGRGQMVPEFEEVAFKLRPGEISEVFETKFGFHFIQLLAKDGEVLVARHILLQVK